MLFAFATLVTLAVWAALLHWHGEVSRQQSAVDAEQRIEAHRLEQWQHRLVVEDMRVGGKCATPSECLRHTSRSEAYGRVIAAYDELVDGIADNLAATDPSPVAGDAGAVAPPAAAPALSADAHRPNHPAARHLYIPGREP